MAAIARFRMCCGLTRHLNVAFKDSLLKNNLNEAFPIAGVRYYRGSNRDTKKRERNRLIQIRKRQGVRLRVFDKWQFIQENYDKELYAFKHRLQLQFHDENNLITALTHESYNPPDTTGESSQRREHNAKFALLGFILTSHYITEYLCLTYPMLPVTGIRHLHDFLVSRENIGKVSELISLPELIRSECDLDSVNNEKHLGYRKEDVMCDAFFALVGAISVDQGSAESQGFVHDFVTTQLQGNELNKLVKFENSQTMLENMLLAQGHEKPVARIIQESGKKTGLPAIVVGVFSGNKMIGDAASYNVSGATKEVSSENLVEQMPTLCKSKSCRSKETVKAMNVAIMKLVQEKVQVEPIMSASATSASPTDHQEDLQQVKYKQ